MIKSTSLFEGVLSRARSDTHAPDFPDYTVCNFQFGKKFIFMIAEWNENFICNKKPEWPRREGNVVSVLLFGKQIQRNMRKWNKIVPEWKYFRHHVTVAPTMMALLYDVTWRHVASEKWFRNNLRRIHIFLLVMLLCLYLNFSSWREFHLQPRYFFFGYSESAVLESSLSKCN